ncbi:hypothetical protein APM13_24110 [Salmonella enterica subsp. enterica serovar Schwarzengrund]|nr:hypothetical protein [Salmonella enterica]EBZ1410685.1 hypothetical protein [Salmonella enterica subsp. enterica serovar Schwarzengrund]EAO0305923.1 hypothetical protein [Salmonella enterica]EBJ1839054.1 hypothetical protein [Salmonella enterica]EBJ4725076.1 hypothetical protein [Salmonella enterica]
MEKLKNIVFLLKQIVTKRTKNNLIISPVNKNYKYLCDFYVYLTNLFFFVFFYSHDTAKTLMRHLFCNFFLHKVLNNVYDNKK